MTEAEWLACTDPTAMVQSLGGQLSNKQRRLVAKARRDRLSDRKLRLFACACCRRVWHLLTIEADRRAVEVAEKYADEAASREELEAAHWSAVHGAAGYVGPGWPAECDELRGANEYPGFMAHQAVSNATESGRQMAFAAACAADAGSDRGAELAAQCDLLRCVVGNPFRPVPSDPRWLTSTTVSLARAIYEERAFDRLPILADALEEAGFDDPAVLGHCRGEGVHTRGCWSVDLVLGKE